MSQRNPMNERYQSEDHQGKTRKSAASAKPKSKAAASVVVQTSSKTPQQKKADAKAARRKAQDEQRALDRKYYNPDTKEYKRLRRLWWGLLGGAVVCTAGSFFLRESLGDAVSMGIIVAAYALIIAKIRKERRAYQDRMVALEAKQKKEERAAARAAAQASSKKGSGKNASRNPKTQKAAAEANAAEQAAEEQPKDEKPARRGLFGSGFRLSNREKAKEEKAAAKAAAKAAKAAETAETPKADAK